MQKVHMGIISLLMSRNHHKVSEKSQGLYRCNNTNDSDHWDSMEANGV